jgi:hypothetical protein
VFPRGPPPSLPEQVAVAPFVICAHAGMHAWTLECSWSLLHDLKPLQLLTISLTLHSRTARSGDDVALPLTTATLPKDEEDDSVVGRSIGGARGQRRTQGTVR